MVVACTSRDMCVELYQISAPRAPLLIPPSLTPTKQAFYAWKCALSAAIRINTIDPRWILKPNSVVKPWEKLDPGKFGDLWSSRLNGVTPVAVRTISVADSVNPETQNDTAYARFVSEVVFACHLQAPCLPRFFGVAFDDETNGSTVLEYHMVPLVFSFPLRAMSPLGDVSSLVKTVLMAYDFFFYLS